MFAYTIRRGVVGVIPTAILLSGIGATVLASDATRPDKPIVVPKDDRAALLLVRSWDPKSGELVGWLPMHRVAITLKQVSSIAPGFDLNEAVTVNLPSRANSERDEVRIAPEFVTFQGRKWLPVQRDVNIVRIQKCLFYVKAIVFGDSKWRMPAPAHDDK